MELQVFAAQMSTIVIGSCGPVPMWGLAAELNERFPDKTIASELGETSALILGLEKKAYRLILTDTYVQRPGILCRKYTEEQLYVSLPLSHPLSGRSSIFLDELGSQSILMYRDLGIWKRITQKNSRPHYLAQQDLGTLDELIRVSDLPSFSSNLLASRFRAFPGRVCVPLADEEAFVTFYLCARESDRELLQQLS